MRDHHSLRKEQRKRTGNDSLFFTSLTLSHTLPLSLSCEITHKKQEEREREREGKRKIEKREGKEEHEKLHLSNNTLKCKIRDESH